MNKSVVFIIILLVIVLSIIVSQYFHKRHHEYKMADIEKAIRKAFEASMKGLGSSLVEIVSTCNSGWKLSPVEANKWMEENMFKEYPKGDLKDTTGI